MSFLIKAFAILSPANAGGIGKNDLHMQAFGRCAIRILSRERKAEKKEGQIYLPQERRKRDVFPRKLSISCINRNYLAESSITILIAI